MTRKAVATRNAGAASEAKETADVRALKPYAEQVRSRAYEIYCERCEDGRSGDAVSDWVTAERELTTSENGRQATALVEATLEGSET